MKSPFSLVTLTTREDFDMVRDALSSPSVDVNERDALGNTPVMLAIQKGCKDIYETLISHPRCDVNLSNKQGFSAISKAVQRGDVHACELLLSRGVDVNAQGPLGFTPLMGAAHYGHASIVELLLRHRARIDERNVKGFTALAIAAQAGHFSVAEKLLAHGASPVDGPTGISPANRSTSNGTSTGQTSSSPGKGGSERKDYVSGRPESPIYSSRTPGSPTRTTSSAKTSGNGGAAGLTYTPLSPIRGPAQSPTRGNIYSSSARTSDHHRGGSVDDSDLFEVTRALQLLATDYASPAMVPSRQHTANDAIHPLPRREGSESRSPSLSPRKGASTTPNALSTPTRQVQFRSPDSQDFMFMSSEDAPNVLRANGASHHLNLSSSSVSSVQSALSDLSSSSPISSTTHDLQKEIGSLKDKVRLTQQALNEAQSGRAGAISHADHELALQRERESYQSELARVREQHEQRIRHAESTLQIALREKSEAASQVDNLTRLLEDSRARLGEESHTSAHQLERLRQDCDNELETMQSIHDDHVKTLTRRFETEQENLISMHQESASTAKVTIENLQLELELAKARMTDTQDELFANQEKADEMHRIRERERKREDADLDEIRSGMEILQTKLARSEDRVKKLRDQLTAAEDQIFGMEKEQSDLQRQASAYKSDLHEASQALEDRTLELRKAKREVTSNTERLEVMQVKMNEYAVQERQEEEAFRARVLTTSTGTSPVTKSSAGGGGDTQSPYLTQRANSLLREENASLREEIERLDELVRELKRSGEAQKIEVAAEAQREYIASVESFHGELEELRNNNEKEQAFLRDKLKNVLKNYQALTLAHEELTAEHGDLISSYEEVQASYGVLEESYQSMEADKDTVIANAKQAALAIQAEVRDLTEAHKAQVRDLELRLGEAEQARENEAVRLRESSDRNLSQINDDYQQELSSLQTVHREEVARLSQELASVKAAGIGQNDALRVEHEAQVESLRTQHEARLAQLREDYEVQLDELQGESDETRERLTRDLDAAMSEKARLHIQVTSLQTALEDTEHNLVEAQVRNDTSADILNTTTDSLQEARDTYRDRCSELASELAAVKADRDRTLANLQTAIAEAGKMSATNAMLTERSSKREQAFQDERTQWISQLASLKSELAESQADRDVLQGRAKASARELTEKEVEIGHALRTHHTDIEERAQLAESIRELQYDLMRVTQRAGDLEAQNAQLDHQLTEAKSWIADIDVSRETVAAALSTTLDTLYDNSETGGLNKPPPSTDLAYLSQHITSATTSLTTNLNARIEEAVGEAVSRERTKWRTAFASKLQDTQREHEEELEDLNSQVEELRTLLQACVTEPESSQQPTASGAGEVVAPAASVSEASTADVRVTDAPESSAATESESARPNSPFGRRHLQQLERNGRSSVFGDVGETGDPMEAGDNTTTGSSVMSVIRRDSEDIPLDASIVSVDTPSSPFLGRRHRLSELDHLRESRMSTASVPATVVLDRSMPNLDSSPTHGVHHQPLVNDGASFLRGQQLRQSRMRQIVDPAGSPVLQPLHNPLGLRDPPSVLPPWS